MSPRFWPNQYSKYLGTALIGLCFSFTLLAQTTPLATPENVDYPGILETFEKLIQIDTQKFNKKHDLLIRTGRTFSDAKDVTSLDLDPDYLNSLILHSDPGYIKLASSSKCRFYDVIINDLLRTAEGSVKNVFITYINRKNERESAVISKKDFLNKVVNQECPETQGLIDQFQIKNLDETFKTIAFDVPTGKQQCHNIYLGWLNNPKTPYLCKINDYIEEARAGEGSPKDLIQRQAVAKILEKKLSYSQRDYLSNLCKNLDDEKLFCEEFLNVSFWSKISAGLAGKIYAEDICKVAVGSATLTNLQLKQCLSKLKKESDLCLYPAGRGHGLTPQPQCDSISLALNHSTLRSDYRDCPGASDQQTITNMGRILLNISKEPIKPHDGPCSAISSGVTLDFNQRFDNDESWKLKACYQDRLNEKEVCYKTYFGRYGDDPESYNNVVANILRLTRGAHTSLKCEMLDSEDYNPLLLQYKSGCFIIYERDKCFISQCKHKIIYNDRTIDYINIKNSAALDYFPITVLNERFSQHYLLTRDYKRKGRSIKNLSSMINVFKKSGKGIIHGVGCAEELLPSFFKIRGMNQCTPLPFIIDGLIRENDKTVFVTRTSADSLQAPRLIGWSSIYSAVKTYQTLHPLRFWTLYGLD